MRSRLYLLLMLSFSAFQNTVAAAEPVQFITSGGNAWWVEVRITPETGLSAVDARVGENAWVQLTRQSWGTWAESFLVADPNRVQFRAMFHDGTSQLSGWYHWPDGALLVTSQPPPVVTPTPTPIPTPAPPATSSNAQVLYSNVRGNNWWIETEVTANAPISTVEVNVGGEAWFALQNTSWGSWAASYFASNGSLVQFRTTLNNGMRVVSAFYQWPSAIVVGSQAPAPPVTSPPTNSNLPSVDIAVDTRQGPNHLAQPLSVDHKIYGMNIADWRPEDYSGNGASQNAFIRYLRALRPGVLRWPAGHRSQERVFSRQGGSNALSPAQIDTFIEVCRNVGAQPLFAVNIKRGSAAQAADWVRYVNVEKRYGVRYWHIGNEPDLGDGFYSDAYGYANTYLEFAAAMRRVDPSIYIIGGELMTGAHVLGVNGFNDWATPVLQVAGSEMDGVSWHYYPLDSNQPNRNSSASLSYAHLLQESAPDWAPAGMQFVADVMPHLKRSIAANAPSTQIWLTEFGEDSGGQAGLGYADRLIGALWATDGLGRYAGYGATAIIKWLFKSGPEHGYSLLDSNNNPRPAYYAYWLMSRYLGDRLVFSSSTDISKIGQWAALRSDGALTAVLINKNGQALQARMQIQGMTINRGNAYVLSGGDLGSSSVSINGTTLSVTNVDANNAVAPRVLRSNEWSTMQLPAYSITVLELWPN